MMRRLGVVVVALLGLGALMTADRYVREQAEREDRAVLIEAADDLADYLAAEIRSRVDAVLDLQAFLLAGDRLPGNRAFDAYSASALSRNPAVSAFYFADARRIVRHAYPGAANARLIGVDLRTRPTAPFVEQAIRERRTTINDPTFTLRGRLSVVIRAPLYRGERLLGLVGGVVDIPVLSERLRHRLDPRLSFVLRDRQGRIFWGVPPSAGVRGGETKTVPIGSDRWTVTAYWRGAPPGVGAFSVSLVWLLGGGFALSLALLTKRGFQRARWLTDAITEKTAMLARRNEQLAQEIGERRHVERELRASEEKFSKAFYESPHIGAIVTLKDGRLLAANDAFFAAFGYQSKQAIGKTIAELERAGVMVARDSLLAQIHASGSAKDVEVSFRGTSGERRYALASAERIEIDDEVCLLMSALDITDRRRAEIEQAKLSRALEQAADMVLITDRDGIIQYVNHAFASVTGYASEEVVGRKPNLLASGRHDRDFFERLWRTIAAGQPFRDVFLNRRKDGSLFYEEKTITPLTDAGEITHYIATGQDITERRQAQERLHRLATHDQLTGLPNRTLLLDRLAHAVSWAERSRRGAAVLCLGFDRFKIINDTLGHDAGDAVLRALAQRLAAPLRAGDTVARLAGDEFAILLEDVASSDHVPLLADKLLREVAQPFELDGRELFFAASIGISVSPADGIDPANLLRNAEAAMYRAKEAGGNAYQFYSADMGAKAVERLGLEAALRHALEREQFVLHYQPQIELDSGRLLGFEALLRWQHPELGLVSPARFVPLLEETGLIVPVGEWALRAACQQCQSWREQGMQTRVSVNLSARQFNDRRLAATVERTLNDCGLDPHLLELEITESVVMRDVEVAAQTLARLSEQGVRLAIDDFGTGYSSLSYLKRFPIDTLKIDSSFVRDVPEDPDDAAIVAAIVALAHRLGMSVIAEGVETEAQVAFLRACHCNAVQGFLYSRPQPAGELPTVVARIASSF